MAERAFISIYKSARRVEMYLYTKRGAPLDELPESLRDHFGKAVHVMDLLLNPDRKLARVEATRVLDGVKDKGFYLQLPPPQEIHGNATPYLRSPESGTRR